MLPKVRSSALSFVLGLVMVAVVPGCGEQPLRETARKAGLIGPFMDLRREDLSGHDLSERDLNSIRLDRAVLRGTDLRNANLERASLRWVDLSETKLGGASLRDADLRGVTLGRRPGKIDLDGADLRGATLEGSDLSQATLDGADLRGALADEETTWPPEFGSPWAVGVQGLDESYDSTMP